MEDQGVTIFVCVSCRSPTEESDAEADRPGPRLVEALRAGLPGGGCGGVTVTPVECLAVCKRPCTVALSAAGKWTYLIGDLDPEIHVGETVSAALAFAASGNGIVPWSERPASFRKGVIARIPPPAFKGFLS